MTTITPELRQAIERAGDEPIRLFDPSTKMTYLLVREHDFLILPIDWSGELSRQEEDGLIREMGESVGWDSREMDVYDHPFTGCEPENTEIAPKDVTQSASVAAMDPLIADLAPEDWEDASKYGL